MSEQRASSAGPVTEPGVPGRRSFHMDIDRTRTIALGLLAAALVALGLMTFPGRSPEADRSRVAGPRPAARSCAIEVAEHAACALPPRREQNPPALESGRQR